MSKEERAVTEIRDGFDSALRIQKSLELLESVLKNNNCSITKIRIEVFKTLARLGPLSMSHLTTNLSSLADRATVYRNIELYEKIGVVQRIYIGWKYKVELSDIFGDHHHHISCLLCGKMIKIGDEKHIDEFINLAAKQNGFLVKGHTLEVQGICNNCQVKPISSSKA